MIKDVLVRELRQRKTGEQISCPGYLIALMKGGESGDQVLKNAGRTEDRLF